MSVLCGLKNALSASGHDNYTLKSKKKPKKARKRLNFPEIPVYALRQEGKPGEESVKKPA